MSEPSKDFSIRPPHTEFSAWDDAKFTIGGLFVITLVIGLPLAFVAFVVISLLK